MAILGKDLREYLEGHLPDPGEEIRAIETEGRELAKRAPWLSPCDRAVGALLDLLVRSTQAKSVLELGTSVGHSAAWIARALPGGGRLLTLDRDAAMIARARANLARLRLDGKVRFERAEHLEFLKDARGAYDLVFFDGTRERRIEALSHLVRLLRPGGLLLADNALWGGEVARRGPRPKSGPPAEAVHETAGFNKALCNHPELTALLLPLGDGVALARRHGS